MRSTINIGKIEGGINTNVVPNLCRTEIDRRLLPTEDYNNSFDEMIETLTLQAQEESLSNLN